MHLLLNPTVLIQQVVWLDEENKPDVAASFVFHSRPIDISSDSDDDSQDDSPMAHLLAVKKGKVAFNMLCSAEISFKKPLILQMLRTV